MKINGYWLALGILGLIDHTFSLTIIGYNFGWIQMTNILFIFLGFGLAFRKN